MDTASLPKALGVARSLSADARELEASVLALYVEQGRTLKEVSVHMGISVRQVTTTLERLGVQLRRRGRRIDAAKQAAIAERRARVSGLYDLGLSGPEIARQIGTSNSVIYSDLEALGKPRRRPGPRNVHPPLADRYCLWCDKRITPTPAQVASGYGRFCSLSHSYLHRWHVTGNGISAALLANLPGRWQKHFRCSWGGRKPPGRGARARGRPPKPIPPDGLIWVEGLAALGYGREAIVRLTQLSERVVRRELRRIRDETSTSPDSGIAATGG
jgi:hypothetical protein